MYEDDLEGHKKATWPGSIVRVSVYPWISIEALENTKCVRDQFVGTSAWLPDEEIAPGMWTSRTPYIVWSLAF